MAWLLEDYGLSMMEDIPTDIQYRRISRQWSPKHLSAVATHPNFCPCPRKNKWDPHATLHSVEYNSPFLGSKATAVKCQGTYRIFFMNMLITWIRYASGLQCFVTLLPTGVVSGMSPLMLINFQRATTNFFCF